MPVNGYRWIYAVYVVVNSVSLLHFAVTALREQDREGEKETERKTGQDLTRSEK